MTRTIYIECGCCGQFHRPEFCGDCRNDDERFNPNYLDSLHGEDGWDFLEEESGLQVRHDMFGYYVCDSAEADFEDDGNPSVGFDGRPHFATLTDAYRAAIGHDGEAA